LRPVGRAAKEARSIQIVWANLAKPHRFSLKASKVRKVLESSPVFAVYLCQGAANRPKFRALKAVVESDFSHRRFYSKPETYVDQGQHSTIAFLARNA
jgi:hypothetical protein